MYETMPSSSLLKGKLPHSLGEKRVSPSFANDQVSPLHNDNSNEKCGLAGIFKTFSVPVGLQKERQFN